MLGDHLKTPSGWAACKEHLSLLEAQMLYTQIKSRCPGAKVQVLTPPGYNDMLTTLEWMDMTEGSLFQAWSSFVTQPDNPGWFIYGMREKPDDDT